MKITLVPDLVESAIMAVRIGYLDQIDFFSITNRLAHALYKYRKGLKGEPSPEHSQILDLLSHVTYDDESKSDDEANSASDDGLKFNLLCRLHHDLKPALEKCFYAIKDWKEELAKTILAPGSIPDELDPDTDKVGDSFLGMLIVNSHKFAFENALDALDNLLRELLAGPGAKIIKELECDAVRINEILSHDCLPAETGYKTHEHLLVGLNLNLETKHARNEQYRILFITDLLKPMPQTPQEKWQRILELYDVGSRIDWDLVR